MSSEKQLPSENLIVIEESGIQAVQDKGVASGIQSATQDGALALKLSPTPSEDLNDPLNWPLWVKICVLIQTSLLAALGGLNTATINPALVQLAREFHISTVRASYQTTVCIALNGIAPFFWIPLAHRYGRRPVWLATTLLGFVSILGCAYAETYTELIIARIFNGLFPVGFALGATTVVDLFYYHQRGRAIGFFTVTVVNGSHLAPIVGGLIGQFCGWRWIFQFSAIADATMLLVAFFCLPETMYIRSTEGNGSPLTMASSGKQEASSTYIPSTHLRSQPTSTANASRTPSSKLARYRHAMRFYSFNPNASLHPSSFIIPTFKLIMSPSAIFPALYYASMYGFASILPAVTVAAIFTEWYHWNTLTIGLSFGAALTIGGILGEICAGWVCDYVVHKAQLKHKFNLEQKPLDLRESTTSFADSQQKIPPEIRLIPIWPGVILTPIGLLLYGFTLHYHTHFIFPLLGMGLSCLGLQIITTTTYTYAIDCHRDQSGEVAQLFNFIRQCFGMTFAFYVVNMGRKIGFQFTFLFFVCCGILAFLPVLWLILRRGREIKREL